MVTNRLALAVVGAACVVAAGAGAFVATRQVMGTPASALSASATTQAPAAAPVQPVQETEAAVQAPPPAAPDAVAPAPVTTPAPVAGPAPVTKVEPASSAKTAPTVRAPKAKTTPAASTRPSDPVRTADPAPPVVARTEPPVAPVEPTPALPEASARSNTPDPQPEPQRQLEELVVRTDAVIGLQLESTVSSETARVEDRVDARVTRDVTVDGRVAIPAGSRLHGAVTLVDHGGKVRDRSRLGVRFHTLVLADGTTLAVQTDTVYREGESPTQSSAAKIGGGAIGGAILGAILGGARGAVIGGTTGAGAGTAAVMAGNRRAATLSSGTPITVRVLSPITVTVED